MMNRPVKKFSFILVAIILGVCVIELLSFVFFKSFHKRFNFYSVQQYLISDEDIGRLAGRYDSRLGWDYHYNTEYSERPRVVTYNKPLISSFGDSYTHCTDVKDNETWQTYLSQMLEADVYNFGTGGYGTDQAYLKYLSVYPKLRTPIVVLGIISENVNRIVNVYRPFYFPKTGIRLPKPRFKLVNDQLELLDNPIKSASEIGLLGDERIIRKLGENDWWYNRDNYPIFRFPYSTILFSKRMWLEAFYGKVKREIDDIDPRPWEDLWDQEQMTDLMFKIVESFTKTVRKSNATPVVMIMPLQDEVFNRFCTGENPKSVSMIIEYCERNGILCFNAIDALAGNVGAMEEIPRLYVVHVSPKGNRIIANELFKFIKMHFDAQINQVDTELH